MIMFLRQNIDSILKVGMPKIIINLNEKFFIQRFLYNGIKDKNTGDFH